MKLYNKSERIVLLKYLGSVYRKGIVDNATQETQIQEGEVPYLLHKLCIDIDHILEVIPESYAQIIVNDFLKLKEENWWKEYYEKGAYEALKNIAMEVFFHCLYV